MFVCRLSWWRSSVTCKLWQSGHFLPWGRYQKLSIKGINTTVGQEQQASMKEKQVLEDLEMHLAKRHTEALFQEQPETGNQYLEDTLLQSYLKTHLPPKVLEEVHQSLERFGNCLLTKIQSLSWECELNPPHCGLAVQCLGAYMTYSV